jgi:L-alanine-DL-glutamate epimerase-like enolase superfamily enzyme
MSIFDQIKADRETGTDGPWRIHDCESMGERCINFYQEIWNDDTDILVTTEVTRAHNDGGAANMRRIARVPQLERIALAAEALLDSIEVGFDEHGGWLPNEAIDALRESCK